MLNSDIAELDALTIPMDIVIKGQGERLVLRLRDDDGEWVKAGDTVHYSYGIPPVSVDARIIERDNRLIGLCPGHNPPEFNLRSLRRYVGNWYKHNAEHEPRAASEAATKDSTEQRLRRNTRCFLPR